MNPQLFDGGVHLPAIDQLALRGIFLSEPLLQKVILYGSRARGDNSLGSDVDLAIVRDPQDDFSIAHLHQILDESSLPYIFDIVDLSLLQNDALRESIDREGVVMYER